VNSPDQINNTRACYSTAIEHSFVSYTFHCIVLESLDYSHSSILLLYHTYCPNMPRVTRAALRSREEQEETDIAACVPLPLTPKLKGRAPLGETSGNSAAAPVILNTFEETMAAAKQGPGKGNKGNATKKATKQKKNQAREPTVEVIEDDNQSQTSSAAEEACKDLLKGDFRGCYPFVLRIYGLR